MSREQWGHGYREGFKDGLKEIIDAGFESRDEFEALTKYALLTAKIDALEDEFRRSDEIRVTDFMAMCSNFHRDTVELMYRYILLFHPYGAFLSGPRSDRNDKEDYFIVYTRPNMDKQFFREELEKYRDKCIEYAAARQKKAQEDFWKKMNL